MAGMTGKAAITGVGIMADNLVELASKVRSAAADAEKQYATMKRLTGARDDDAAAMLSDVAFQLGVLQNYVNQCCQRLAQVQADPFGKTEEVAGVAHPA